MPTANLWSLPWSMLWPETVVLLGAMAALVLRRVAFESAVLAIVLSLWLRFGIPSHPGSFAGAFRVDGFTLLFQALVLVGTLMLLVLARRSLGVPAERRPEYASLFLFAALGGMVLAGATDLVLLFVGLETLSIASYILVGMRKGNRASAEGAMKYILSGATATAVFLFGASYLVGWTGATDLGEIGRRLADPAPGEVAGPLLTVGFMFVLAALSFKIVSLPFYMWAPDVYQGAPIAVTTFLAAVSKTAGFAALARIVEGVLAAPGGPGSPFWHEMSTVLAILAAASMVAGNVIALRQKNTKRLLAYSSIAHAGYLLIPLAAFNAMTFQQLAFYLWAYLFMNVGVFAVLDQVARAHGSTDMAALNGLSRRSPLLTAALTVLVLSLAGMPLTAGFFAKWYVLTGALAGGKGWLGFVLIATTVVSYAYYFHLLRHAWSRAEEELPPLRVSWPVGALVVVAAGLTLLIGVFPGQWLGGLQQMMDAVQGAAAFGFETK
ncbi:MAG: NADH-quinone oxidoreductase subunit N [Kyrpidia tusciae]|nr:NADH-quinone oxidoreductase subunit N [Kyrpidia tusciae]MBE3552471.1 NADH-quinone oxidoreductase subunit N [Kyrpidia tusciae]